MAQPEILKLPGIRAPLRVNRSARAKRISLKIDSASGEIVLTMPKRARLSRALDFAREHRDWIKAHVANLPEPVPFAHGARIPYLGVKHEIIHKPDTIRGMVERRGGRFYVPGPEEHLSRRLTDFLKAEARREISTRAHDKAEQVGKKFKRLRIADQKTRWGSCSRSGTLSFSWRLIMTPDYVFDYIVAHEIAHLVHMNHSERFWTLCNSLTDEPFKGRHWLNINGTELMRYGRDG